MNTVIEYRGFVATLEGDILLSLTGGGGSYRLEDIGNPRRWKCSACKAVHDGLSYARDAAGNLVCYSCAGERDKAEMLRTGKATLYLAFDSPKAGVRGLSQISDCNARVTNWPGTLAIPIKTIHVGRHNLARRRCDVWFDFAGMHWHGVQYGDNTQICHVRRVK